MFDTRTTSTMLAPVLVLLVEALGCVANVLPNHVRLDVGNNHTPPESPLMALYHKWTLQYVKDAEEAERAAKLYASLAKEAAANTASRTSELTKAELARIGVPALAKAYWKFEHMLDDPTAANAAAAAEIAAAPYEERYKEYTDAQLDYKNAAISYTRQSKFDVELARQLKSHAKQSALEGDKDTSTSYNTQADMLITKAESYKTKAIHYQSMAARIQTAIPQIEKMIAAVRAYVIDEENPLNVVAPDQLIHYTVAPPLSYQADASIKYMPML